MYNLKVTNKILTGLSDPALLELDAGPLTFLIVMSSYGGLAVPAQPLAVIQQPRPRYYRRPFRRGRYYRKRRPLRRGVRTFMRARRKFPAKDYGYMFIPRTDETLASLGSTWREANESQRKNRMDSRYYGQGSFFKKAWKYAKPYARQGAEALIGRYLGNGIYTGDGSYDNANELVDSSNSDMIPKFVSKNDETGELCITHREYVAEIYPDDSVPFLNRPFELNPGLEKTFPWLSQIAQNFEEYQFEQLMFSYRSTVADVSSASGQVGTVILSTNYNPSHLPFQDKGRMLEYSASVSAKTVENVVHGVECDPAKLSGSSGKYVRATNLKQQDDIKEYDHGLFQLATANTPAGFADKSIGELWVSYTVKLRKPKLFTGRGDGISRVMYIANANTGMQLTNSHAIRNVFGNAVIGSDHNHQIAKASNNSWDMLIDNTASTTTMTFPGDLEGVYAIKIYWRGECSDSQSLGLSPPALAGNITPYYDIVTGGAINKGTGPSDPNPNWYFRTQAWDDWGATTGYDEVCMYLEVHVLVQHATQGQDNILVWGDAALIASTNAVVYYVGQDGDTTVNTQSYLLETVGATNNNAPATTAGANRTSTEVHIQEIPSNWGRTDRLLTPEFVKYNSELLVDVI